MTDFGTNRWLILTYVEKLRKISIGWLGRTSVTDRRTDRRQTDGRQQIANVNTSSHSLKNDVSNRDSLESPSVFFLLTMDSITAYQQSLISSLWRPSSDLCKRWTKTRETHVIDSITDPHAAHCQSSTTWDLTCVYVSTWVDVTHTVIQTTKTAEVGSLSKQVNIFLMSK